MHFLYLLIPLSKFHLRNLKKSTSTSFTCTIHLRNWNASKLIVVSLIVSSINDTVELIYDIEITSEFALLTFPRGERRSFPKIVGFLIE